MNILIFGDSITQGYNDTEYGGWANRLLIHSIRKRIETNFEYENILFILGISGGNTNALLKRIENELKSRLNPAEECTIIFAIGVNDSQYKIQTGENNVPTSEYRENLRKIIQKTFQYKAKVLFIGIPPVDENLLIPIPWKTTHAYDMENVNIYNQIGKDICEEFKLQYIDMDDVYKGFTLIDILSDGIHPNAKGHKLIFDRLKAVFERENLL